MTLTTPVRARQRIAARMRDGRKTYGIGSAVVHALDGVDIDLEQGTFTAVMGPSGSGKSTLLHTLAGLDTLDGGEVWIGSQSLAELDDRSLTRLRRDRVGFVFQAFNLVPTLSARENVLLPLTIAGRRPEPDWYARVIDTLGLGERLEHRPAELSGGQQQRVAAARALVSRPEIVFADEPSGNLDSRSGAELLGFMRMAVHELGQTIVMVTHDAGAAAYSDRAVFLSDGRLQGEIEGPTADAVLDRMKTLGA
jgi:putative ABC transport system ATP-binding protein